MFPPPRNGSDGNRDEPEFRSWPSCQPPSHQNQQQEHQQSQQPHRQQNNLPNQQHDQIASLLQYAQTSYNSRPTDALSALMEALTLCNGEGAARQAMNQIRCELGDVVANAVASGGGSSRNFGNFHGNNYGNFMQQQHNQQQICQAERDLHMTQRAMQIVQELMNDTSTFLHGQGRQHLLQQAMEDGSSVVCTRCGDMIKRERWSQHCEFWCQALEESGGKEGGGLMEN
mmetsp:Transcript_22262/g.46660  ORF Transcript_22262/g.46660 Transcript_22262/m.46660 type:complete len:229 (+) Transcript_22262:79-765(+)